MLVSPESKHERRIGKSESHCLLFHSRLMEVAVAEMRENNDSYNDSDSNNEHKHNDTFKTLIRDKCRPEHSFFARFR